MEDNSIHFDKQYFIYISNQIFIFSQTFINYCNKKLIKEKTEIKNP